MDEGPTSTTLKLCVYYNIAPFLPKDMARHMADRVCNILSNFKGRMSMLAQEQPAAAAQIPVLAAAPYNTFSSFLILRAQLVLLNLFAALR